MNNRKVRYFLDSALRYFSDKTCPYCKSSEVGVIDKKYIVTRLFECNNCHLYFRHPKDKQGFNETFYQEEYDENGITTNIPEPEIMKTYLENNFKGTEKDYSSKVEVINALTNNQTGKVVDYGTSWGYVSYQFKNAGFNVQSYEISKQMCKKGNELLSLDIKSDVRELKSGNQVFFSSHVMEHLSDINELFAIARNLLTEDGLFIAFTPNGSKAFRKAQPTTFSFLWGLVHPNFINEDFYSTVFKDYPYIITSNPYNSIDLFKNWDGKSQLKSLTTGDELLFVCKINQPIK